MAQTIIQVEKISKRYLLSHQSGRHGNPPGYRRFSDVLINTAMKPFRRLRKQPEADPRREEFWALRDVSFEVKQGEVLGIIGRNGAGKSTLLKILSRITGPTSGRIEIAGRVASLLEVGTGFHPELTGRENIFLNGAVLGMSRHEIKKKFDEIVAFAEVEKFLDTPVKHYSSGMYVRLAFAVAAHLEPEILVVDEVLAVGDAEFQKKCLGKMQDVSTKEGRTVIFVSHNMGTVSVLCTKGLYLKKGRIDFIGTAEETINHYVDDSNQNTGEQTWPNLIEAPGNEKLRLRAVRIISEGKTTSEVPIDKEVHVEIDYLNQIPGTRVCPSVHLFDHLGVVVLTSANFPSSNLQPDPWFDQPSPVGAYRVRCTLPASLLNEGKYRVTVILHTNRVHVEVKADDVVTFTVLETGEMRREYSGPWAGVVRPRLGWQTEPLGAS
jgi:lipopolysaccharide transport system ATP-binding protein